MEFDELISLLMEEAGLTKKEIQGRIAKKKDDLNQLVTDEGAAYIVARELGIEIPTENYTRPTIVIRDLLEIKPGIGSVTITGRIMRILEPQRFEKEDRSGVVQRILIADNTGEIDLVLWNQTTQLISEGLIERGDIIRVVKGYLKEGFMGGGPELHIGRSGKIETVAKDVDPSNYPVTEPLILEKEQLDVTDDVQDIVGLISNIGDIRTFEKGDEEGKVASNILHGQQGPIRIVFWNERVEEALSFSPGDEILIEGCQVRKNRNDEPEIHVLRSTRLTKLGSKEPPKYEFLSSTYRGQGQSVKEIENIGELEEGQQGLSFRARIIIAEAVRAFNRGDGSNGRLQRITVILPDGNPATMVLWDERIEDLKGLSNGDQIKVSNAYTKPARDSIGVEIHLGNFGNVEKDTRDDLPSALSISALEDLEEGKVSSVMATTTTIFSLNEFNRKDGTTGQVASALIADGTGEVRLVCWNEAAQFLSSNVTAGTVLEITVARVKTGRETNEYELHVNTADQINLVENPPNHLQKLRKEVQKAEDRGLPADRSIPPRTAIKDLLENENAEIKAMVVKVTQRPPYYLACPNCGKKAADLGELQGDCKEHGPITPERRLLVSVVLDDSTGSLRTALIGKTAEIAMQTQESILDLEDDQKILEKVTESLLGKELLFRGQIVVDKFRRDDQSPTLVLRTHRVFKVSYEDELKNTLAEVQSLF